MQPECQPSRCDSRDLGECGLPACSTAELMIFGCSGVLELDRCCKLSSWRLSWVFLPKPVKVFVVGSPVVCPHRPCNGVIGFKWFF